jgi:lipopolysaccharide biosynthesis protein
MTTIDVATQFRANIARGPQYRADCEERVAPADPLVHLIAFYLPQFHRVPENDRWWGPGFTEWTNVTKALPLFEGHYQPHLPGGLGFYDLGLPEILREQAATAKKYGIHGFCFYHYWFGGKRLLEKPLNLLLSDPDIDLPFCVCWANENWTRRWDGLEEDVLIAQNHNPDDDVAFARSLEPLIRDPRYIRVRDRPLIIVYRPALLPNPLATARRWRAHFARVGLADPFLVMAQCFGEEDPRIFGFDAAVEFPPHKVGFRGPRIESGIRFFDRNYRAKVYRYDDMVACAIAQPPAPYKVFRGVCPSWDNVARIANGGTVFSSASPDAYARWLESACRSALLNVEPSERLVFINAWNEWTEGAHLEPDRHFGYAYLHATARALAGLASRASSIEGERIAIVSHNDAVVVENDAAPAKNRSSLPPKKG